jgi:hypothetical protein
MPDFTGFCLRARNLAAATSLRRRATPRRECAHYAPGETATGERGGHLFRHGPGEGRAPARTHDSKPPQECAFLPRRRSRIFGWECRAQHSKSPSCTRKQKPSVFTSVLRRLQRARRSQQPSTSSFARSASHVPVRPTAPTVRPAIASRSRDGRIATADNLPRDKGISHPALCVSFSRPFVFVNHVAREPLPLATRRTPSTIKKPGVAPPGFAEQNANRITRKPPL